MKTSKVKSKANTAVLQNVMTLALTKLYGFAFCYVFPLGLALSLGLSQAANAQGSNKSIISADLGTTQLLQALEMEAAIIAVDLTSAQLPGFERLPNIGYHRQLSAEGLLSLDATMLIGSSHMGPERTLETLRSSGVRILQYETPYTSTRLMKNIQLVATELDLENAGRTLNERLLNVLQDLEKSPFQGDTAVYLLDMGDKTTMAGTGTGGDAFLKLLSLKNLASFQNYRDTSNEALMALKPAVVILGGRSDSSQSSSHTLSALGMLTKTGSRYATMDASTLVAGLSMSAIKEASRVQKILSEPHNDQ